MNQSAPNNQILQQLHDLHLPAAISNWPQTVGWYILLVLIMIGISLMVRTLFGIHHRHRIRSLALKQLAKLGPHQLPELSSLLKCVALAYYPRNRVASLHGIEWLKFLDETSGGKTDFQQQGKLLVTAPYQALVDGNVESVHKLARVWIKHQGAKNRYV